MSILCSLRAVFGTDDERNAVHGSDSSASAEREIRFFFPDCELLSLQLSIFSKIMHV